MLPGYCSLKNQREGLIRDLHLGLSQPSHQQLYCLPDPAVPALLGLQCIIFLSKLISLILYLPPSGFLLSPTLCSDRRSGCISPCLTSAYKTLGSAACPWITAWLGWCAGDKENKAKMHKTFIFFYGILEGLGLEGTFRIILFQPHCHGQGQFPLDQIPNPVQPGPEHSQGWGIHLFWGIHNFCFPW